MRKLIAALLLMGLAAAATGAWLWSDFRDLRQQPLIEAGEIHLWLDQGTSFQGMIRQLEALGVTQFDWRWRLLGRLEAPMVKAGEYRIVAGSRVDDLLRQVADGEVLKHRFTIVEGWTVAELRDALLADTRLRKDAADLDEDALMRRLGCPDCAAEGRFLPETYFFVRGSSDLALLQRAHDALQQALAAAWSGRSGDLPLDSPDELLILASLIERETGQAGERARVAGVFVRRLEKGMRLQTDPTVMYGLGDDFQGRLRRVHLRTDHPWNTYTRHGLPLTPIALPGRASLEAAAQPAEGTALYFVARGDGSHQFSDTLSEHNAAVDRYIRGRP